MKNRSVDELSGVKAGSRIVHLDIYIYVPLRKLLDVNGLIDQMCDVNVRVKQGKTARVDEGRAQHTLYTFQRVKDEGRKIGYSTWAWLLRGMTTTHPCLGGHMPVQNCYIQVSLPSCVDTFISIIDNDM